MVAGMCPRRHGRRAQVPTDLGGLQRDPGQGGDDPPRARVLVGHCLRGRHPRGQGPVGRWGDLALGLNLPSQPRLCGRQEASAMLVATRT